MFIPPNTNNIAFVNLSEFIDGQISYDRYIDDQNGLLNSLSSPQTFAGTFSEQNTQCVQKWTFEVKEGYDVAGVFTIDDASVVTYPAYYVKGYKTAQQGGDVVSIQTIYPIPTASVSQGWLTQSTYINRPWIGQRIYANAARAICVPTFASHRCSFAHINDDGTLLAGCIATKYRYNLYNESSLLATQDYTIPYAANSTAALNKLLYAGIGLWNIENTDVAIIPANEKPSNFPTWTHYTIQLLSNSAQASQVIAMYNYECYTKPFTLRWTNDVGGVEHYTFDGGNMVTDEIERVQTYDQGHYDTGSPGIFHRKLGERTAMSSVTQSIELKTGMLTVEERKFLATIG